MTLQAFVFKNRGLLLERCRPRRSRSSDAERRSVALGLPLAIAGELLRCWAVGYSGVTTRNDAVTAPELVTGRSVRVRAQSALHRQLHHGRRLRDRVHRRELAGVALGCSVGGSLAAMAAVYATIVPHEEAFLRSTFGEAFERYCERVPRIVPQLASARGWRGRRWNPRRVRSAESKTFALFGAMLAALVAARARKRKPACRCARRRRRSR